MSASSRILLEVAIASVEDAQAAETAGADRLELSAALSLGGLTPSFAMIREVVASSKLPVLVLIRPRPGGFHYSESEFNIILQDIDDALAAGAAGIVTGVLNSDASLDRIRCEAIRRRIGSKVAVFHRAFDVVPDPLTTLKTLIAIGFDRILTSGQEASAVAGREFIRALIEHAEKRIEILPGGGINHRNIVELVRFTHCTQVHGSMSGWKIDHSLANGKSEIRTGLCGGANADRYQATDPLEVARTRARLDEMVMNAIE